MKWLLAFTIFVLWKNMQKNLPHMDIISNVAASLLKQV